MLLDPRFTPGSRRSGFSSRATILALAGGGAALFLFVILPQLMTSQAAELRRSLPEERVQADGAAPKDELVAATVLPPAADTEQGSTTVVETASLTNPEAPANATQLVASTETPAAPKLKRGKGTGGAKTDKTTHQELHAAQREKRKEQRAAGIDPKPELEAARAKAKEELADASTNRDRIQVMGKHPGGQSRGRGNPKKKKDPPTDG